ncbi:Hypothetical predicted protein [Octopus vulgaris]|uniref:ENTH domain-containing protein n=1 Tax=Octopus vulgaris TaxID=6645 RepID=A0AA36BU75_OCTVU|nr:Hypothetical predicted protein [Octopus vulgaris]
MEVVNKVSFVNKINMLMKATSDDDKPIPGYLYDEVNKISYESTAYCTSLLEFLVSQLEKKSCHVKLKVLKLMTNLVEKGHPHFRQGLRRQANGIREATKFSGPPDPLHGTVPYLVVRQMAQNLSEVLFDADYNVDTESETKTVRPTSISTGMGNIQGKSRMEGFGSSPQHLPKSTSQILRNSIGNFLDKFTDSSQINQVFIPELDKQPSNFAPVQLSQTLSDDAISGSQSMSSLPAKLPVPHHVPGRAGGGWDDDDDDVHYGDEDNSVAVKSTTSSSHTSSKETKVSNEILSSRRDSEEYSMPDWNAEDQLVCEMIENTRPLPTRSDLEAFVSKCSSLNCEKVIDLINQHLQTDAQLHSQLLCLFMLEWLSRADYININLLASVCKDSLLNLYNNTCGVNSGEMQLVHSKCRKIIRILEKLTVYKTILPSSVAQPIPDDNSRDKPVSGEHMMTESLSKNGNFYGSEADGEENCSDDKMKASSIFHFIHDEEMKNGVNKELEKTADYSNDQSPKQPVEIGLKAAVTDNELSDVSSQPSVGSEFSLLNEDSLEVNES